MYACYAMSSLLQISFLSFQWIIHPVRCIVSIFSFALCIYGQFVMVITYQNKYSYDMLSKCTNYSKLNDLLNNTINAPGLDTDIVRNFMTFYFSQ